MTDKKVAILMGSANDAEKMQPARDTLERLGIEHEVWAMSAHRNAEELIVEGTLGVLAGSLISAVLGAVYVALLSRRYPPVDSVAAAQRDAEEQLHRTDGV